MIIGIDFDGTCVTHEFPKLGEDIGAQNVLSDLVKNGHQLILWTMRSGEFLNDATKWFVNNNIPLYGINNNPNQIIWTSSPKAYCHIYIDDAALGCPLIISDKSDRPYVNWNEVRRMLIEMGLIDKLDKQTKK